jgi:amino acid transporter
MAFTAVNLSVISLYRRQHPEVRCLGFWRGLLIPAIGALFDFFMLFNLDRNAQILGVLWLLFGLLYLTYLTGLFKKAPPEMIFADESAELSEA